MSRKQQRTQKMLRQQAIRDAAKAEGRDLTDEEQTEFDNLQRDIERLTGEIDAGLDDEPGNPEPEDAAAIRNAAITAERSRIAEINSLCRSFDVEPEQFIANGNSIDEVRAAVLTQLSAGRGQNPLNTAGTLSIETDESTKFRAAASDALVLRAGQSVENPAEGARDLRGMSLRDLAIECLVREEGENATSLLRMTPDDMYSRLTRGFFNPTAAFPAILDSSIEKSIVDIYNHTDATFPLWTTEGTLKDFKPTSDHEYLLGGLGDFEKVPENGELKNDVPSTDLLPTRKLDTYGKQFSMTRQAFINDDIGFITKIPGLYARKGKMTIEKQVYSILFNNSKIFDGISLFDKKHSNIIASGTAPTLESLQMAIQMAQLQKDPFGDPIYVTPKFIIVPVGYSMALKVILRSTHWPGSNNNDINPLYNEPLTIIEVPMLNMLAGENAIPWFLVADPASAKSIQVDYLNGNKMPTFRRSEKAGTLGFIWDIYHDWGITAVDWRGIIRNNGTKLSLGGN